MIIFIVISYWKPVTNMELLSCIPEIFFLTDQHILTRKQKSIISHVVISHEYDPQKINTVHI